MVVQTVLVSLAVAALLLLAVLLLALHWWGCSDTVRHAVYNTAPRWGRRAKRPASKVAKGRRSSASDSDYSSYQGEVLLTKALHCTGIDTIHI